MGWQRTRVLVHAPTRTLVRCNGGHVQVLRAGVEIASVHASAEVLDEISIARDGTLFVGANGFLDLNAERPTLRAWAGIASSGDKTLHPDGRVAVVVTRACTNDPNTYEPVRAFHRRVPEGRFQIVLVDGAGGLEVLVEGSARLESTGRDFDYLAEPMFAADGEHWAILVASYTDDRRSPDPRLVLGRGDRVLAHRRLALVPSVDRTSFDLARGIVVLASRDRGATFSLADGSLVAEHTWPASMQSPLVPSHDALVAALATNVPKTYALHAFDPATLAPLGPLANVSTLRDSDGDFGLAPLGARGLAWAPPVHPVVLVDADASWTEGPLVRSHLAPPSSASAIDVDVVETLASASPAERIALASQLIERRERDPRFVRLVRSHPEAFHPHLATLLAWPREWKAMLRQIDWRRWPEIARGASDAIVDALADAVAGGDAPTELELLVAADTTRALLRLADLARAHPRVRAACGDACLEIPASGPAIRRFDPDERVLHATSEGAIVLETRLATDAWLDTPRGILCLLPPTHLLRVPLDRLRCDPHARIDALDFALSTCARPGCDEWGVAYEARAGARTDRVTLVSDWLEKASCAPASACCPGEASTLVSPMHVTLASFDPDAEPKRALGRVGGRPEWTQHADHPACPSCERMMFFVGQIDSGTLGVSFFDLFGFVCERCAVTIQIRQNT